MLMPRNRIETFYDLILIYMLSHNKQMDRHNAMLNVYLLVGLLRMKLTTSVIAHVLHNNHTSSVVPSGCN